MAKLISSLPIGAKIKLGKHQVNSEARQDIIWQVGAKDHVGYPANSVTLVADKIIDLRGFDAVEPSNLDSNRRSYGNNRYKDSNLRQWLNKGTNPWFVKTHNADEPPITNTGTNNYGTDYNTRDGFLKAFNSDELAAILDTSLSVAKNTIIDGGGIETVVDKVFLLSNTEVGLANEPGGAEGSKLPLFTNDSSRACVLTQQAFSNTKSTGKPSSFGVAWFWWLRSPYSSTSYDVRFVNGQGATIFGNFAYDGSSGVRPALNLKSALLVSDNTDSDGAYRIIWNQSPSTPPSITVPTTVKGGETLSISWGTATDTDGNLSGYILQRSVNGGTYTQVYKGANRSFTDSITKGWNTVAYRVKAYDSKNAESGYTTSATRTVINNTAPTISGSDSNLGDKNLGFLITYQVNDIDTSDSLIVTEKLNGSTIRTINGAPRNQQLEIEITNETLFTLPLNSSNTIEIKVDDQQGGIAYRRFTFRRTNSAPVISGQDEDLGQKTEPFSIDFSASDNEGNVITVKTYLNNVLKEEYQAEDGVLNTFTISKVDWYKLPIAQHSIKIEAIDEHGATAVRNYSFTRYDDKIQFNLKNPIETDIMATKILVTPTWIIPEGAIGKVEACNNGHDENPAWEDITSQVEISRHYNFTNDIKTADEWGIDIRFTIEKGTATEECVINGFGGAFE